MAACAGTSAALISAQCASDSKCAEFHARWRDFKLIEPSLKSESKLDIPTALEQLLWFADVVPVFIQYVNSHNPLNCGLRVDRRTILLQTHAPSAQSHERIDSLLPGFRMNTLS